MRRTEPDGDSGFGSRKCSSCQQLRPVEQFYLDPKGPDGHTSQCRTCRRKTNRSYYARQKKKGLCVCCGQDREPDGGMTLCGPCLTIQKLRMQRRYRVASARRRAEEALHGT